ncbi:MAG TPA: CotY/CotZ family spore coat protein [Pseudogracilibacillus sp.]|nr:CotY/CotZ family spore coat protein [Pseudogracilibacillus sp.]
MGCQTCGKEYRGDSCVCSILKDIARAQKNITEMECQTSCEKSINDLLGQTDIPNNLDTIPFILYCKDSCKPFKGYGANARNIGKMVASYYFRVKSVTKDCCAVIELLRDPNCGNVNPHNPMDQQTKHLRATGICITVDVKCFCHITCLPAISVFN